MHDPSASRSDRDDVVDATRGDRRWLPSLVVLVLIGIPFVLPLPHTSALAGAVIVLGVPLLVAVVAVDPGRVDRRTSVARNLSIALTLVLVGSALVATGILVAELLEGAPDLASATTVLWTGFLIWIDANLTFALLFWQLDGGGPAQRLHDPPRCPDLAFPQHMNPDVARPGWMP